MADDEKEEEVIPPRGADWEVVSLTASTYAAAPDAKGFDPNDNGDAKKESPSAMFMSDHFVFPPSEHENLPIEPDCSEIHNISEGNTEISYEEEDEEERQDKLDDGSQGTEFLGSASAFSAGRLEVEEDRGLQGLYSVPYPESTENINPGDSPNLGLNSPRKSTKSSDGDDYAGSGYSCVGWWKKHASSFYRQAKEANTFWSIVVAAALTGLVILGKRWHRDKWHAQELSRHMSINDEVN